MKAIKILGNDGNTVYTDLKDGNISSGVTQVVYGITTRDEMLEHLKNNEFMVCQYHTEGYNTTFRAPLMAIMNSHQHGQEIVEFVYTWVDGTTSRLTYNAGTDEWSNSTHASNDTVINSKELTFGEMFNVTEDDKVNVSLNGTALEQYIKGIVSEMVGNEPQGPVSKVYDIMAMADSYTANDTEHNWYDFTNTAYNIVSLNEDATVPTGTPNFGDKYIPSYTMGLSGFVDIETAHYLDISLFTLNSSPVNFKLIDVNGKASQPILIGKRDKITPQELWVNTNSHQEITNKLSSIDAVGYTNATTLTAIQTQIQNLKNEFDANGHYTDSKCLSGIIDLNDMMDGLSFDDGFDKTKVVKIEVQLVENWDKSSITWKARNKAVIFNTFRFTETSDAS